jgi:feruloyl-CoA synthase
MRLRSPQKLGAYARCVGELLEHWAKAAPQREFLAERTGEGWRKVRYGEARDAVRRIGQALLERGLSPERPLAILSDNSVDHALLALGAMHAGVPVAPISPAYSLMSKDHAKLKYIFELVRPGLVYAADPAKFAPALAAVGASATPIDALLQSAPGARLDEAFARAGPDTVAKILFTSGSTGEPKGVINTQRMLCANQQMLAQGWPWVEEQPPVLCEWLPWNHTFGGNHDFNLVLRNGGAFYVDGGKPMPGLIDTTARNLKEVAPTIYFNVPRGFDLLLPPSPTPRCAGISSAGCRRFSRRRDAENLWSGWRNSRTPNAAPRHALGVNETSPLATQHFHIEWAVGLLAVCDGSPSGSKRRCVKGPNVTPGY